MIVVFGSLNVDLVFPVAALPGPGETVLGERYSLASGGKGANQAAAAARAGAATRLVGCVGEDAFADRVTADVSAAGVDIGAVRRVATPTGCAAVAVDGGGENQILVASGANLAASADQVPDAWLAAATILLMQLEVPPDENWKLLGRARSAGARTILNAAPAKPVPAAALAALDVLIVNEPEAAALARRFELTARRGGDVARDLARRFQITCIVTLGAAGAVAARPDGAMRIGALSVAVVDTTGAGDAFVGVLAASLGRGADLGHALHRASVAGGLACTRPGAMASQPQEAEIEAHLGRLAPPVAVTG